MTATETVAIIGSISTPLVAIAGYMFREVGARRDREHETKMRRGERAYEDRKSVYRSALRWALVGMTRIQLTEPLITYPGMPEPPEAPGEDEWREVQVDVSAYGSREVFEVFETFLSKMQGFNVSVMTMRAIRDQVGPAGQQTFESRQDVERSREEAATAYDTLRTQIRDELANL